MGNAHVPGQVRDTLAVLEHLGRHAIALALEDAPASRACCDTTSILATVLEIVETLVQVDSSIGARGVGENKTENAAHLAGSFWGGIKSNNKTTQRTNWIERASLPVVGKFPRGDEGIQTGRCGGRVPKSVTDLFC